MNSHVSEDDLATGDHVDWLESQFFNQTRLGNHDLDWGPVASMPRRTRRAAHAVVGMVAVAIVGFVVFVMYANLIMPVPVPSDAGEPLRPPSAASPAPLTPNGS